MIQFSTFKTHLFDSIDNSALECLRTFNIPVLVNLMHFLEQTIFSSYDIRLLLILIFFSFFSSVFLVFFLSFILIFNMFCAIFSVCVDLIQ